MADSPQELTLQALGLCRSRGFALVGCCSASPSEYAEQFRNWIETGRHGEMAYMARNVETWVDPSRLLPGARSIICVADRYHRGGRDRIPSPPVDRPVGRVARYARGDDYHRTMKKRLHEAADALREEYPDHKFRVCVDTAPILEREYAQRAGLGAVGKNTLLIEPGIGSYMLLGEILTTLKLQPTPSRRGEDVCATCTRCIDACPTDAITPYSVDATRCISYLTIEYRSEIDSEFHRAIGDWIFGCDICQEVCPHNHPTRRSTAAAVNETYRTRLEDSTGFDLFAVLDWTEEDRRAAFVRSAMKRAKLEMMKRNAIIAAGNRAMLPEASCDRDQLIESIKRITKDEEEPPLIRRTAAAVLSRIGLKGKE